VRFTRRLLLRGAAIACLLVVGGELLIQYRVRVRVHEAVGALPPDTAGLLERQVSRLVRGDLVVIGATVVVAGVGLAALLLLPVVRPVEALWDDARAVAASGRARPAAQGPGAGVEAEERLTDAVRRLAEQLEGRTDAQAAEEALRLAIADALTEGVIAVDARRRVVRINETARQLLRTWEPVPFPVDRLPPLPALEHALAAVLGGAAAPPAELVTDDRTLSLTTKALPGGGAVLALNDLTPFRRLEAVRRDFVANVSHELRTPLTVISGFVETLQDEALPPALRRQFLGMAEHNVRRMQRIVDDLLDLSRIESGGWRPKPVVLDVAPAATEVLQPLQGAAAAKGVALRTDIAPGAEQLFADPTAVRQVLANLAENALRHTLAGEVVVFSAPDAGGLWLGVRDTGVGISAEHLPRIFERFYRADPGRSREAGGTGLGLSIVRHLAESHGGRVRAESTPGSGTTIAAFFPDRRSDADPPERPRLPQTG
jgi:two-component system phosphate regulon sensor histidine kinase PhoR